MPEGKGSQVTTTWILLLSVLQLTQSDSPPRPAPSRPRTFGVVSLLTNRRRVGGAVSGLLTLVVRFGESRPQPLVAASLIPMSKVACRVSCPLVQIFRRRHHVSRGRYVVRGRLRVLQ